MKGLNGFLAGLSVILLIVAGSGILGHNFGVIDIIEIAESYAGAIWTVLAGAAMLIFGVISIVLMVALRKPEKSFSIQNPDGEMRITFSAIEDMLKKSTSRIEGIEDIRPKVVEGKRGLEILSRVSVMEDVSIPQLTMRIQDVVKSQIRDVLGIEEVGAIRTHIYKISARSKSKSDAKAEDKFSI
jgi:uncharacterized alkaline shock family protein YloU